MPGYHVDSSGGGGVSAGGRKAVGDFPAQLAGEELSKPEPQGGLPFKMPRRARGLKAARANRTLADGHWARSGFQAQIMRDERMQAMKQTAPGGGHSASQRITNQIAELGDWRGATLAQLRRIILASAPGITEEWKWGTGVWTSNGLVCSAGVFKDHVKLNFFKGASLKDPKRLFNAGLDAKATRAIDFGEGEKVAATALKELIRAAIALNASRAQEELIPRGEWRSSDSSPKPTWLPCRGSLSPRCPHRNPFGPRAPVSWLEGETAPAGRRRCRKRGLPCGMLREARGLWAEHDVGQMSPRRFVGNQHEQHPRSARDHR